MGGSWYSLSIRHRRLFEPQVLFEGYCCGMLAHTSSFDGTEFVIAHGSRHTMEDLNVLVCDEDSWVALGLSDGSRDIQVGCNAWRTGT